LGIHEGHFAMNVTEQIANEVKTLPPEAQQEVLDFVGFLRTRLETRHSRKDDIQWSEFSIGNALRGMEEEAGPEYSEADLKERWR
jgi:Protein of unknown function (DUF2281)